MRCIEGKTANTNKTIAVKLKWNLAGTRWNSGLQWNGTAPTNHITMARIQIALKLDSLSETQLANKGTEISTGLTDNASDFTGIAPTAAAIATAAGEAGDAIAAAATAASAAEAATLAKDEALAALRELLTKAAKWTENNISDPAIVTKVFPLRKAATPAPPDMGQVMNLTLAFGAMPGKLKAVWEAVARGKSYEVQVRYRDVAGSVWTTVKILSASNYTLTGLTSGQIAQVRVRAIGPKGLEGEWSDLAEHMVP